MKTGDDCPTCPIGRLVVYCTRWQADRAIRFLRCDICGATAGKEICRTRHRPQAPY